MLQRLLTPFRFGLRSALIDIILVGNSFVWYFIVLILLLQDIVSNINPSFSQSLFIWGLHFGGLIVSAVAGTFVSKKIQQRQLIILWMALGTISSIGVLLVNPSSIGQVSLIGLFLGISLGFGMPTCIGRYANSIAVENRGRTSGITLFASGIGIVAFSISGISGIAILGIVLTILRFTGLIIFLSDKPPSAPLMAKKSVSRYKKIIGQRSFILYFVPWIMFSLLNYLIAPITGTPVSDPGAENLQLVQTGFIGLSALLSGFFIDSIGRKRVAVTGFILLGLGTAVLGIFSPNPKLPILFLNVILDGTAFGCLFVLFILTLWGDLSYSESSEKYYALGVIPFFVAKFLDLTISSFYIIPFFNRQGPSTLFSFGAFFLFLAVLPLIYAPETLPEKAIKDKNLKSYVEKARKVAMKEDKKNSKEKTRGKTEDEIEGENDAYEKARKLAEKYY